MYLIGAFVTQAFPAERRRRRRLLLGPDHRPGDSVRRGGADRRLLRQRQEQERDRRQGPAQLPGRRRNSSRPSSRRPGPSNLPTSPDVDPSNFSPLVQKGIKLLQETKEITQFFNRDSSDALQTTADTALTKFLDKPGDVVEILKDWQAAAQQVWNS